MFWISLFLLVAVLFIPATGWILSQPGYDGPKSDNFNGTTFENVKKIPGKGFFDVMEWYLNRDQGEWEEIPEDEVSYAEAPASAVMDALAITYVNHSTFLIQTAGLNILTDPVWSDRVSPFSFAGPKRMRPPGLKYQDLPEIDVVLISHNHYDHLDLSTLKKLNKQFSPTFVVPLGVDRLLQKNGIKNTVTLDWWQEHVMNGKLSFHSVPAQHFSARGLFDRDKTLWAGYVLETEFGAVYFAGDTGYGPIFEDIGNRFKPVKVALIPIGAYKPRWFMSPVHLDPAEAIQVHKELQAEISFGMHFGTFPLADDGQYEPKEDFARAMQLPENQQVNFKLLTEGDTFTLQD